MLRVTVMSVILYPVDEKKLKERGKEEMEPTLPISKETHANKYRSHGETFKECCNRIANELKDDDEHYHKFRDILLKYAFPSCG